ncbi:hypothetical protein, partial [Actinomyces sp. MRS3W]|uniref:hypothetical protein n=1 Tax=Actinomyces sp. MRS3W TaxID=2800796 RepID=UPI0028FD3BB6
MLATILTAVGTYLGLGLARNLGLLLLALATASLATAWVGALIARPLAGLARPGVLHAGPGQAGVL